MTLTRPAYMVTITNHTRGWSLEVTQGDTPDPDAGAWLLEDGWSIDWSAAAPWRAMDPTVATFAVFARDAIELPDIDYDDEVSVTLARPAAVGDPIVVIEAFGPVTDLDADSAVFVPEDGDPITAVRLSVILTDPTSILSSLPSNWGVATDIGDTYPELAMLEVGAAAGVPVAAQAVAPNTWAVRTVHDPAEDLAALFDRLANSHGNVLASLSLPGVLRVAHDWDGPDAGWTFQGAGPYRYYLDEYQPYLPLTAAVDPLLEVQVQGRMVTAVADGDGLDQDSLTALSACLAESPMAWSKNQGNAPTAVKVTYPFIDGELDQTGEYVASTWHNPASKGAEVELPTQLRNAGTAFPPTVYTNGVVGAADRMARLLAATPAWGTASIKVLPRAMTDDEWDRYATRFYPRPEPIGDPIGRYVVLTELESSISLAGLTLVTQLLGATFGITGGQLVIELQTFPRPFLLTPGVSDADVPGPTVTAWNAVPALVNTTAADQGGSTPYIDPRMTADDAKLAHL